MVVLQIATGFLLVVGMAILMSKSLIAKRAYGIWGLIFVILFSPILGALFQWSCAAGVVIGGVIVLRDQVEKALDFKDPKWSKNLELERRKHGSRKT